MSKSPNKHNRIYAKANFIEEEICAEIEKGSIGPKDDPKTRAKDMAEKYGWDRELAGVKLWNFGPENVGPNCLIDATKGIAYMNEIRDSCESGW